MSSDPELERILKRKMEELKGRKRENTKAEHLPSPIVLNDNVFEQFINKNRIAVVDFWAPWCGPCRIISPIIEELSKEYSEKVAFGKLNVDENPLATAKYGVNGIPTVIFFVNGQVSDRIVGAAPKYVLESRLKQILN